MKKTWLNPKSSGKSVNHIISPLQMSFCLSSFALTCQDSSYSWGQHSPTPLGTPGKRCCVAIEHVDHVAHVACKMALKIRKAPVEWFFLTRILYNEDAPLDLGVSPSPQFIQFEVCWIYHIIPLTLQQWRNPVRRCLVICVHYSNHVLVEICPPESRQNASGGDQHWLKVT